jgi:transcriptional regulator with XRE-family HTH domain
MGSILQARLSQGYTQEQVAHAIGVSRPTYAGIEAGKKELTIRQAETLSSMLRVGIGELLGGEGSIADVVASTEKYKQIMLNALQHGADNDGRITKTKLAKLVYLADFIWYYLHATPMSGVVYRKLPRGPIADVYFRALDEMEEDGAILRETRGNAYLYSLVEKQAPTGRLSEDERALIEKICTAWHGKPTEDIVSFTHRQLPWQICRDGEVIPYSLITQEEPELVYGAVQL